MVCLQYNQYLGKTLLVSLDEIQVCDGGNTGGNHQKVLNLLLNPSPLLVGLECDTRVNPLYNDHVCSKLSLTLKWICCYKEMLSSTRIPHHDHLVIENIIQMNLNAIVPIVYISSISYCLKMHKASLLSNVTKTCPCKRPYPDQLIDWHMVKNLL